MPIPDFVTFGPDEDDNKISYGDFRQIADEKEKIKFLKLRLDSWLINQIGELGGKGKSRKVYSPFPLALLSCNCIETIGQIFVTKKIKSDEPKACFTYVCNKIDKPFSRNLGKAFKNDLATLWPKSDLNDCSTCSDLIFTFFRNSMAHYYRARGVYLTEEIDTFSLEQGYMNINPYWLWSRTKEIYECFFDKLENVQSNHPYYLSVFDYIKKIIT